MTIKPNSCSELLFFPAFFKFGIFATLIFSGCGPGVDLEKTVTANGTLTYQGKPLEGYKIVFHPLEERQGATAESGQGGAFTLGTNEPGDGAAPGKHRVSVNFIAEKMEGEPGRETFLKLTPKVKIPGKYQNPDTSGIEIEVPENGSDALSVELK